MLAIFIFWDIILISYIFQNVNSGNPISIHYYVLLTMNLLISVYIILVSANINDFFRLSNYSYLQLQSQVYEILCYAKDYLIKGTECDNAYLKLAINKLRIKAKVMSFFRKVKRIFKIKKKHGKNREEQILII
jgi:hypothetical protein